MSFANNIEAAHDLLAATPRLVIQGINITSAFYDEVAAPPPGANVTVKAADISFVGTSNGWTYSGMAKLNAAGKLADCILKLQPAPSSGHSEHRPLDKEEKNAREVYLHRKRRRPEERGPECCSPKEVDAHLRRQRPREVNAVLSDAGLRGRGCTRHRQT